MNRRDFLKCGAAVCTVAAVPAVAAGAASEQMRSPTDFYAADWVERLNGARVERRPGSRPAGRVIAMECLYDSDMPYPRTGWIDPAGVKAEIRLRDQLIFRGVDPSSIRFYHCWYVHHHVWGLQGFGLVA